MRVIAYVVSGIGFLGAGVIMKQGMDVRGLNTAATLWASAADADPAPARRHGRRRRWRITVFVIAGNTLLRPLVNAINRIPLNEQSSEATYYLKLAVVRLKRCPICATAWWRGWKPPTIPWPMSMWSRLGDDLLEIVATLISARRRCRTSLNDPRCGRPATPRPGV